MKTSAKKSRRELRNQLVVSSVSAAATAGVAYGSFKVASSLTTGYWDVAANPEAIEVSKTVYDGVTYYYNVVEASIYTKLIVGGTLLFAGLYLTGSLISALNKQVNG